MSLGYLISPALQLEDINGKPLVGGYLVTYLHGTTTPYITYADFDGNHNPAKVPLNARGMAILLADADNLYDVYCYDCHDVEQWSRINIGTVGTGGEGGAEVSYEPSLLRTSSAILNSDGDFQFNFPDMKVGNLIDVVGSRILVKTGFYHFSVTAKMIRSAEAQNTTRFPKVHGPANDLGVSFDMTYAHNEEITLSGDVRALADDFELRFWASDVGTGLQVLISSISVHAITNLTAGVSEGILPNYGTEQEGKVLRVNSSGTDVEWGEESGGGGGSGAHRLLRYYTDSSEADENHPQGDWLHDLEVEDPDDPSGHPMVTAEQMFAWQADGQVFDLYEKDRQGGMVKWNAVYHQQSWRDQTDWWERYSGREGKSCRIEFWRGGLYSEVNRVGLIAYIRHINEDYMRLYQIIENVDIWEMKLQPALPDYSDPTEVGHVLTVNSSNVLEWTSLPEIGTITI